MTNENNPNLTEMIREIHDGVAREMYCKGVDDFATLMKEAINQIIEINDGVDREMYCKGVEDFSTLMKAAINQDWATTKTYGPLTYNRLFDKCNEIADELKEMNK